MNITNQPAFSIWQIAKMAGRLLVVAMLAKATGSTTPTLNISSASVLCRVEHGGLALLLTITASAPSRSRSRGRKSLTEEAPSSSTGITRGPITPPRADASSSLAPFESGSLGQAFEP